MGVNKQLSNVAQVNNDFHQNQTLFEILEGLEVKEIDVPHSTAAEPVTNGTS